MPKQISTTYYDENGEMSYFLTQWDINRRITIKADEAITSTPEVHFFNKTTTGAIKSNSVDFNSSKNEITVSVPNILLQSSNAIYMYVYFTSVQGVSKTVTFVRIPVRKRPKPKDYSYSDTTDVVFLEDKISEVNRMIDIINNSNIDNKITAIETALSNYDSKINSRIATISELQSYIV